MRSTRHGSHQWPRMISKVQEFSLQNNGNLDSLHGTDDDIKELEALGNKDNTLENDVDSWQGAVTWPPIDLNRSLSEISSKSKRYTGQHMRSAQPQAIKHADGSHAMASTRYIKELRVRQSVLSKANNADVFDARLFQDGLSELSKASSEA